VNHPNELRAIGERLLMLAESGIVDALQLDDAATFMAPHEIDDRYLISLAKSLYLSRRLRERYLDAELFGEPAWDMLLDLFVQAAEGKRTAVTSLCAASGVPPSTALRWITTLQDAGLILREEAEHDRRVAYLKLSARGFAAVRQYLAESTRHVRPSRNWCRVDRKLVK
jgi:DNA-binding MarR family transcriptional regulator